MALFILRKLILQMRMRSHPVGLDVWYLIGPFVYFHTSYMRTAKALVRLRGCAGSPSPSLVAYVISIIISWAVSNEPRHEKTCLWGLQSGKTQTGLRSLEMLDLACICIILSRQRTTKALIRLRGCAGWSVSLLFTYGINTFSHGLAQMNDTISCNILGKRSNWPHLKVE